MTKSTWVETYIKLCKRKWKNTKVNKSSSEKKDKINYIALVILHSSNMSIFNACKWPTVIISHHQTWISFVNRQKVLWIIQLRYWGNDEEAIYRWVNNRGQRQLPYQTACSQNNECLQHATSLWMPYSKHNKKADYWMLVLWLLNNWQVSLQ